MVSVHTVVLGQITQCNPCTQCPLMGGLCLRKVENNSCFMSLTGKVTKLLSIYERAPLKEVPVFLCVQLSKVSAQGRFKKKQCFYVTGAMSKCPIEQGVCTREVKNAKFVCGWDHDKMSN